MERIRVGVRGVALDRGGSAWMQCWLGLLVCWRRAYWRNGMQMGYVLDIYWPGSGFVGS